MVDFIPFHGIRYSADAGTLPELICGPYDVLSSADEQVLLSRNPNNFVRVELSEPHEQMPADHYSAAATVFEEWLASGVLAVEQAPSYYLLRQRFGLQAATLDRYALYGALRLEPFGEGVLPHEDTAAGPKADRLALMESTAANLSPLMMLYRDDSRSIATVRNRTMARPPLAEFTAYDGQHYALWRIDAEEDIGKLASILANERVYIADGHHRYETALAYAAAHPEEAAQYVMTCLIDFDDPGLRILPYNRVIRGLTDSLYEAMARWTHEVFFAQALDVPASRGDTLEALANEAGASGPAIIMVGPGDSAYLLTLQDPESLRRLAPSGVNVPLHYVEAWVLQQIVLRPLLASRMDNHVTYTHDSEAAALAVAAGEAQYAFIAKGVPTDLFERIVGEGVRMPRKSTYFWPKLPSGLVSRRLTGVV